MLTGADCPPETVAHLAGALKTFAAEEGPITDVHSVRVRRTPQGLVAVFHCRADPALSIGEVHEAVDRIERRFRRAHPEIVRVVGHAEPRRPLPS